MQNHGALCVGPDLDETFTFVELLEKISTVYVNPLATGKPIGVPPAPIAAQGADRSSDGRPQGKSESAGLSWSLSSSQPGRSAVAARNAVSQQQARYPQPKTISSPLRSRGKPCRTLEMAVIFRPYDRFGYLIRYDAISG
jgi:hypothetical protein